MNVLGAGPGFCFAPSGLRFFTLPFRGSDARPASRVKLKAGPGTAAGASAQSAPQLRDSDSTINAALCMPQRFLLALFILLLPAMAEAADVTGIPKIREGDHIQIGNSRIRLGG